MLHKQRAVLAATDRVKAIGDPAEYGKYPDYDELCKNLFIDGVKWGQDELLKDLVTLVGDFINTREGIEFNYVEAAKDRPLTVSEADGRLGNTNKLVLHKIYLETLIGYQKRRE